MTLRRTAQVRVYRRARGPSRHYAFACDLRTQTRTRLARVDRNGDEFNQGEDELLLPGTVTVHGRLVSYAIRLCGECSGPGPIHTDIVTVRLPHRGPVSNSTTPDPKVQVGIAFAPDYPKGPPYGLSLPRLLIGSNDSGYTLVYSTCASPPSTTITNKCRKPLQAVRILAGRPEVRTSVLDAAPGIDPLSLRLSSDRRSAKWTVNGQTKTAPLPP